MTPTKTQATPRQSATPTPSTPAQASSLYQQLRGHLAVLRLHDAAEHLPAVLDAARDEQLSLTAALERLLAIEVAATEARRLTGRLRFASLPTPARLSDIDYDAAPSLDRALITELATGAYLQSATNVLLIGPPGVGKTMIAVGLGPPPKPATAPTSPPPPTWPPAATAPRSKDAGPPPCASSPAPDSS